VSNWVRVLNCSDAVVHRGELPSANFVLRQLERCGGDNFDDEVAINLTQSPRTFRSVVTSRRKPDLERDIVAVATYPFMPRVTLNGSRA
jgi:hypothetical protein